MGVAQQRQRGVSYIQNIISYKVIGKQVKQL